MCQIMTMTVILKISLFSKTKVQPKGSRPKGGVEVAKKARPCDVPNCGGTNHNLHNCSNKLKIIKVLPSQSPK